MPARPRRPGPLPRPGRRTRPRRPAALRPRHPPTRRRRRRRCSPRSASTACAPSGSRRRAAPPSGPRSRWSSPTAATRPSSTRSRRGSARPALRPLRRPRRSWPGPSDGDRSRGEAAAPEPPAAARAPPVTAGDHVLAYVRAQRDAIVELDPAVRRDLPDSVHRMRVATRRMRSTFRSYAARSWTATVTDPIGDELKWLAGELGVDRDQEVLTERLDRGPRRAPARPWSPARSATACAPGRSARHAGSRRQLIARARRQRGTWTCSTPWTRWSPTRPCARPPAATRRRCSPRPYGRTSTKLAGLVEQALELPPGARPRPRDARGPQEDQAHPVRGGGGRPRARRARQEPGQAHEVPAEPARRPPGQRHGPRAPCATWPPRRTRRGRAPSRTGCCTRGRSGARGGAEAALPEAWSEIGRAARRAASGDPSGATRTGAVSAPALRWMVTPLSAHEGSRDACRSRRVGVPAARSSAPACAEADPVRRRRAQLHGQALGRLRRPLGAHVPGRVRGRAAQPGRHDPLRGAERARGRPRRAHVQRVAGPRGADAGARRPAVHRGQPPPGEGLRRVRPVLLHGAGLHEHAHGAGPGGHPAGGQGPHASTTRSCWPAATRPSTPSRSPTSSTRRSSATASRPCST